MPTFSAIQLDRFLEQGASKTTSSSTTNEKLPDVSDSPRLERRNTTSLPIDDLKPSSKRQDIPPPHPQLRRRNSTSSPVRARAQITPSLYATPEPTPIPDSPTSSFPPSSPFLINHKRRGPRLIKSFSDRNVAASAAPSSHSRSFSEDSVSVEQQVDEKFGGVNGSNGDVSVGEAKVKVEVEGGCVENGVFSMRENGDGDCLVKENGGESEDFFDPQESMSYSGTTDTDDYGGERSSRLYSPVGEFYDAWEELSSDSGLQAPRSLSDVETELRDMRLSLLMEIERRKQAEEALQSMQQQWQLLREKLGAVGLLLPADFTGLVEDSQAIVGSSEDICRQVQLARFVSESIGRGIAKAEAEEQMETQLEMKNFEIARLCDRLHYYETVNHEMSQRNQEAIENARLERQKRKRRQLWALGSIGAAGITLGTAASIWLYFSSREGSSSSSHCEVPQADSD